MANMMGSLGDYGSKTVAKAIANGAKIVPYQPKPGQEDLGGYYDAASNSVYVNSTRPPERQANVLVHESQHANNLLEGTILTKEAALAKGEEAYIVNFLQDEARAHAAGFIYAHQTQDRHELDSHATQALFKDVAYNGADDAAFARYSAAALKQLENGALGYRERAHESFAARSKEQEQHVEKTPAPKKHEQPSTEIELSGLEHALTHELEHFAHK